MTKEKYKQLCLHCLFARICAIEYTQPLAIITKQININQLIKLFFLILFVISCNKNKTILEPTLELTPVNPPFTLTLSTATFYKDISYDTDPLNLFDFFMPNKETPSSLCIIVHGGGFLGGDKTQPYSVDFFRNLINNLLLKNIAVASINYRFIEENETEGIIKCLNDAKRALQFMRYYSNVLNFNKQKVVMLGRSAGAGISLWIGFNDDIADTNNSDPILRESTRIQGIIAISTQSNYDILQWHNNVFSEYQQYGFDYNTVKNIITESLIFRYFGVNDSTELFSNEIATYRNNVNMLNLMSNDDPEFYIINSGIPNTIPTNTTELYHHPLHLKALLDKANITNTKGVFYCPELGIDMRNGESIEDFISRKIGE